MSEEPTGTFGQLETGARFRTPWTYGILTKVDHVGHNATDERGNPYNIPGWWDVIQEPSRKEHTHGTDTLERVQSRNRF